MRLPNVCTAISKRLKQHERPRICFEEHAGPTFGERQPAVSVIPGDADQFEIGGLGQRSIRAEVPRGFVTIEVAVDLGKDEGSAERGVGNM